MNPVHFKRNTTIVLLPVLILVIFLLPFYSEVGYSIIKNSISELGAQNTPNAYIMNTVFVLLGMGIIIDTISSRSLSRAEKLLILTFGVTLTCTGIFSTKPISPEIDYNELHSQLHSIFATISGFAISIFAIVYGIRSEITMRRLLAFLIALITTLIPILMFNNPEYAGILQRVMFVITFTWLGYIFGISRKT